MHRIQPSHRTAVTLCALGLLATGGCPTATPTKADLPAEISAVIAARESVEIAEDDPASSAAPGRVVDNMSGLNGCWASYTSYAAPDSVPAQYAEAAQNDVYNYYRFDTAAGQMTNYVYGELRGFTFANLATYKGTFAITNTNHLTFNVVEFTVFDPYSSTTLIYPEDFAEQMRQSAANGEMTQAELDEVLAELAEPLVFEYLVTLEGDRLTLVAVWENDDGTQGTDEEAQVCFRFDCPN